MNPRKELLEHIPNMRAFAMSLCGRADRADDLVQDTWTAALESPPRDAASSRSWLTRGHRSAPASTKLRCCVTTCSLAVVVRA